MRQFAISPSRQIPLSITQAFDHRSLHVTKINTVIKFPRREERGRSVSFGGCSRCSQQVNRDTYGGTTHVHIDSARMYCVCERHNSGSICEGGSTCASTNRECARGFSPSIRVAGDRIERGFQVVKIEGYPSDHGDCYSNK